MKRIFAVILLVAMVLTLAACGKKDPAAAGKHQDVITKAVTEVKKSWQKSYDEDAANGAKTERYFQIVNTRVVTLQGNAGGEFQNVGYVVEFDIYSDYFGTAPYYQNAKVNNNVLVYFDGRMEVGSNVIKHYADKTGKTDLSDLILSVDDYQGAYNCTEKLK